MKTSILTILLYIATFTFLGTVKAQEPAPSAKTLLDQAYARAAKEKKNVMVIFHASWCGWCHKMDDKMNTITCKPLFDDNYVIVHLIVLENEENKHLENAGANDIRIKYHGEKMGIPFWLIFDKSGKLIGDSQIRPEGVGFDTPGSNTGFPAQPEEMNHFMKVLKQTSSLNEKQLAVIKEEFLAK